MDMKIGIGGEYNNNNESGIRQVRDEYESIASIWNSEESNHDKAEQFVKLLKRFTWNKIRATYKETEVNGAYLSPF
ncbi:MAG: hypothetical protein PHW08_13995 [Kiritimatiellae bacterium]|nr:hypothetical protein [Kiritimatiellia bacterium]